MEHFPLFVYAGIEGIGKTALVLELARQTRDIGLTNGLYVRLSPGENLMSVVARLEAYFELPESTDTSEPYSRLVHILEAQKACLVLDDLHELRREDLPSLLRVLRGKPQGFRVLAATQFEPQLSVMDRNMVQLERVGPLAADDAVQLARSYRLTDAARTQIAEDAKREGSVCHPLTLVYMLGLWGSQLPSDDFLKTQKARSVNCFRALMQLAGDRFGATERQLISELDRVGLPISQSVATRAFGAVTERLIKERLLEVIDDNVHPHPLVTALYANKAVKLQANAAKAVARHLVSVGQKERRPLALARAGELMAGAGLQNEAVEVLADGWESVRDLGFLEAYLKTLSQVDATGTLDSRVRLLSAQARLRKHGANRVRADMEALAEERDRWTRARACAALVSIYASLGEHRRVVTAYETLRKATQEVDLLLPAGVQAAGSLGRTGKVQEAERLAKELLKQLKGPQNTARAAELHRLLARIYAQAGRLMDAIGESQAAATAYESAGDLYHAATAQGFIGDLYRESGDFELAQAAFQRFRQLANTLGDRDLMQIAELAEAWVSLDIGDLTHAAQQIETVERNLGAAPSRRLRRYLAAGRALLEAGRGNHKEAAGLLARVIDTWDAAGQRAMADLLRAQQIRSLIASGDIEAAERIVQKALERLDAKNAAPRVATFLRERALIRLRRKDVKTAMQELAQAQVLFAQGGNRREEALTLHRIAHAAFDEGDIEVASERAEEALKLGRKIKHARAIALARELQGRVALCCDDANEATKALREAAQKLRKLGDEVGALHVTEWLLRAQIFAGDLAAAMRIGPKVRSQAEKLGIAEIGLRAMALSGVAFLRRNRLDAASRCFKDIDDTQAQPLTVAMMWRLGEALAAVKSDRVLLLQRRERWVRAIRLLPDERQDGALHSLEQLLLPPRDQCVLRTAGKERRLGTEEVAWFQPSGTSFFADLLNGVAFAQGQRLLFPTTEIRRLFVLMVARAPQPATFEQAYHAVYRQAPSEKPDKLMKPLIAEFRKLVRKGKCSVQVNGHGLALLMPADHAVLVPTTLADPSMTPLHRQMIETMRRLGTVGLQAFQDQHKLTRAVARRELDTIISKGLVTAVRDGRGQAFRLT